MFRLSENDFIPEKSPLPPGRIPVSACAVVTDAQRRRQFFASLDATHSYRTHQPVRKEKKTILKNIFLYRKKTLL